jgi:hypothetical protein
MLPHPRLAVARVPGRVLARACALALALACALALPAAAQQKLARGFPLDADGSIKVHNDAGLVRVVGWAHDSVAVSGAIGEGRSFFGGGGRRGIKLGVEGESPRGARTTLVLFVPAGASVWVRGADTDVEVEGLTGSVDVATVSGRLRIAASPRDLVVESMDGAVEISGAPAVLRARTASGPLTWRGRADDALLATVSGRIEARDGPLARARIETVSGAIVLDAAYAADAQVVVESHGGDVELRVPDGAALRIEADAATVSGAGASPKGSAAGKRPPPQTITLGAPAKGGPSVTVRTFKGALRIVRP